jgi:hypothetical protein
MLLVSWCDYANQGLGFSRGVTQRLWLYWSLLIVSYACCVTYILLLLYVFMLLLVLVLLE